MKLPFFILGGGSNLLVSDEGYKGLVIKFGQPLSLYVPKGLEWATGIPGTLQGAVFGNAGAFGKSMKDIVKEVKVFDTKTEKIKNFKNKDCQFSYKNSIFRKKKNLIILSVKIKTKKVDELRSSLRSANARVSNAKKIKEYFGYKKETQPLNFPSAGSIFRNFTPYRNEVSGAGPKESKEFKKFKEKGMIPAAYLIDKCSLKGKRVGNVKISEKHANFIVNLGNGKAKDVKKLIKLIKNKVKKKFGVVLKEEIQIF
jgi:UDP-N-acetylmuramate dehydrogenase